MRCAYCGTPGDGSGNCANCGAPHPLRLHQRHVAPNPDKMALLEPTLRRYLAAAEQAFAAGDLENAQGCLAAMHAIAFYSDV